MAERPIEPGCMVQVVRMRKGGCPCDLGSTYRVGRIVPCNPGEVICTICGATQFVGEHIWAERDGEFQVGNTVGELKRLPDLDEKPETYTDRTILEPA